MTLPKKAAASLLISIIPFVIAAILGFTGLFNAIETRFYNPSIARALANETKIDAGIIDNYLNNLQEKFYSAHLELSISHGYRHGQILEALKSVSGLKSVQVHFCDDAPGNTEQKIIINDALQRIFFSFPAGGLTGFYGTASFSLPVMALAEYLVGAGRLRIGEDISLTGTPPGILRGIPHGILYGGAGAHAYRTEIISRVSSIWNDNFFGITAFNSPNFLTSYVLVSAGTSQGILYGRIVYSDIFAFPKSMQLILLISVFLTIYLAVFLLFNLRQDPELVVRARIKNIQKNLIEQFYDNKIDLDWARWTKELEQRGGEIKTEIKRGIKTGGNGEKQSSLDILVDKSWDDMLAAMGGSKKNDAEIENEPPIPVIIKKEAPASRKVNAAPSRQNAGNFLNIYNAENNDFTETAGESNPADTTLYEPEPKIVSMFEFVDKDEEGYYEPEPLPAKGLMARCLEARKAIHGQDGIHFINSSILQPDSKTEAALNSDFKVLVESVIKK